MPGDCPARTFAEQVEGLTTRHARRTPLLRGMLEAIGLALAGRAGARLACRRGTLITPPTDLAKALRAHARGLHPLEAATELLINHAYWLHRSDFTTDFISTRRGLLLDIEHTHIDWPSAITASASATSPAPAAKDRCSGSPRAWPTASQSTFTTHS